MVMPRDKKVELMIGNLLVNMETRNVKEILFKLVRFDSTLTIFTNFPSLSSSALNHLIGITTGMSTAKNVQLNLVWTGTK